MRKPNASTAVVTVTLLMATLFTGQLYLWYPDVFRWVIVCAGGMLATFAVIVVLHHRASLAEYPDAYRGLTTTHVLPAASGVFILIVVACKTMIDRLHSPAAWVSPSCAVAFGLLAYGLSIVIGGTMRRNAARKRFFDGMVPPPTTPPPRASDCPPCPPPGD